MKLFSLLSILFCFFTVSCTSKHDAVSESYPVLGLEPIADSTLVEDPRETLVLWARKVKLRKMTAVHFSGRDGLAGASDDAIRAVRTMIKKGQWTELEKRRNEGNQPLFTAQNYLFTAASLGIVQKIYWVVPGRLLLYSDAERRVQLFLEGGDTRFSREDISGMKYAYGCVSGTLRGVAVSICSPESLPSISEPVFLDLDVEAFSQFAQERKFTRLRGFKEFFDILATKRIRSASTTIVLTDLPSRSIHRYIGTQAREALSNPAIMKTAPPELWALRNDIDRVFFGDEDPARAIRGALKKYPTDGALVLYGAVAAMLRVSGQPALETLGKLCGSDKAACDALLYVANRLMRKQHDVSAEACLKKAIALRSDWPAALRAHGELLYVKKDYAQALLRFQEVERLEDGVSIQFSIADCFHNMGRESDALSHYTKGLSYYEASTGYRFNDREKDALTRLLRMSEEQGDSARAKIIKRFLGNG